MSDLCTRSRKHRRVLTRFACASILACILLAITPEDGNAQALCLSHDTLVKFLQESHSEEQVGTGLETGGHLFEIFATANGRTWTMVVTTPDGASCVIATGLEWQELKGSVPDPKS